MQTAVNKYKNISMDIKKGILGIEEAMVIIQVNRKTWKVHVASDSNEKLM